MFWKKRKSKDEVLEQAAKWFARLRAEDFSQDEKRQFEAWLNEDTSHHRVKLRLEPDFWNKRFTGTFSNSDLNEVLSAIKVAFSLKTKTAADGSIVLCSDKQ